MKTHKPWRTVGGNLLRVAWLRGVLAGSLAMSLVAAPLPPPARLTDQGVEFECLGRAAFRWMRVIHVYDAVLHVGAGRSRSLPFTGSPLRLEIRYRRGFTAEEIVRGGDALLRRNVSAETFQSLRPRLDRLNRAYRDIRPGDRYTLTYLPGRGTTLRLNDTELVTIEGADFAEAYFRIWLGDDPISPALRDQLLGR
ncbi:MAG: chalcone isomerase family protein [Verrucomicrobiota bacterium]